MVVGGCVMACPWPCVCQQAPPSDPAFLLQLINITDFSFFLGAQVTGHACVCCVPTVRSAGWLCRSLPSSFAPLPVSQFLVYPMLVENATNITVNMPDGASSWYEYFRPSVVHPAGSEAVIDTPWTYSPVFAKTGSILPLRVTTSTVGNGDCSFASAMTFVVHTPVTAGTVSQVSGCVLWQWSSHA